MSEAAAESAEVTASHGTTSRVTAGSLLRTAREREGLHIAALAVSMKVPVKKLEALEADRLDLLPDAVFVRALAASVCRLIGPGLGGLLLAQVGLTGFFVFTIDA